MSIKRQNIRVLRFWYRLSHQPEVEALTHPARWWLYGVVMAWTGFNNGVIEFTRVRHGKRYGLTDRRVFERARRDVLATGLVSMTREGGPNLAATYMLTTVEQQASPTTSILGGLRPPMTAQKLGGRQLPIEQKNGGLRPPSWGTTSPKDFDPHIKIARASDLGKEKCTDQTATVTTATATKAADRESSQMEDRYSQDCRQSGRVFHDN